ncbi:hypothetical protein FIBSPDRAFT_797890 [Athelia psychrophila]|uniref:BTB domain-containing protein n=1 Tax=Athelia psychrophila TaxID=1759441 RepID=A0A166C9T1_9AGAM|nr:hypothetical protein FIBSPDRAFT_797890 [Fibularhizoctonia sp. CBS 109695]
MADSTHSDEAGSTTRSEIWFEDGNVVLQAEGTHFKVYRGALAAHSPIFKDVFAMPQPPSEGEAAIEGCPVVHLSDTAADVTIVLKALFLLSGHIVAGEPLDFAVVAAFLRLGKKYEIELLYAEALKRLRYEFPSTLKDLDEYSRHTMIKGDFRTSADVAKLAREQSLLCVLPLALYQCCCYAGAIFNPVAGITRDAGTTTMLSAGDFLACLLAGSSLSKTQVTSTLAWLNAPRSTYPKCTSPAPCANIRKEVLYSIYFPSVNFLGHKCWSEFKYNHIDEVGEMCSSCNAVAEQLHNDGRAKFWEALPGIFGLSKWAELMEE